MSILNQIIKIAKEAAAEAAKIQMRGLAEGLSISSKGESFDIVTNADVEAEKAIAGVIHSAFPDHNILGEEEDYPKTSSAWLWIVDPIDGTTNYSRGLPYFSVSIAVWQDDRPQAAVVYNPFVNEMFWAVRGQGAFLNDRPIRCSAVDQFSKSVFITGFYYDRGESMDKTLANIGQFLRKGIMGIRRFGSAAMDLCYVAAGRADAFFEIGLNAWDFAGGAFIAAEAGALVTSLDGLALKAQPSYVIAGTPALHPQVLAVLRETEASWQRS